MSSPAWPVDRTTAWNTKPWHPILMLALLITGCGAPAPTKPKPVSQRNTGPTFVQYIPATQPAVDQSTQALPTDPKDAPVSVPLVYSVEIWEILLPRDSVSTDEGFWKRVNEQAVELSTYDVLFKNGMRVGELPIYELDNLRTLIDERKGQRTSMVGVAGKHIEIPIASGLDRQTLFYFDRSNKLIGRTYERCDNVVYFSFEPTPRRPDRIRLALTPAVRGLNKRWQLAVLPGRESREFTYKNEEFHYDANLRLDLPLQSVLVIAPSTEARVGTSLGAAFLIKPTPAQELERLLVIVPRAFKKEQAETAKTQ